MPRLLQHLLLASAEDPFDPKAWSGSAFAMREALERQVDKLSVFRPPPPARTPIDAVKRVLRGGARYPLWITKATLRQNAKALQAEITRLQPQAILSIASVCITELPHPGRPLFLVSDAPFQAYQEAYKGTIDVPDRMAEFEREDARAALRLDGLCYASAWGVAEALRLFGPVSERGGLLADRLHVTPMGANWVPKLSREEVLARAAARPESTLELLFLGRDWERKGGPLAVEVTALLRQKGQPARLHVVGCNPELAAGQADYVTVHGPLYQDDPVQAGRLADLLLNSHFLLTPTKAECFGIGFAEAQAFALPPVSRAVQALPGVVEDGVTGLLFAPEAPAADYVERILALRAYPQAYQAMTRHARDRYEQLLNWDQMARSLVEAIDRRVAEYSAGSAGR